MNRDHADHQSGALTTRPRCRQVTLSSNTIGVNPLGKVKRRVKGRGEVSFNQPFVVKAYNNGMGGVNLFDKALSDYRPCIMKKKWYWYLLVNALNISVVFTWRLYKLVYDEKIPQKDFRMKLLEVMMKGSKVRKPINRPSSNYKVLVDVRFDSRNHYPSPVKCYFIYCIKVIFVFEPGCQYF